MEGKGNNMAGPDIGGSRVSETDVSQIDPLPLLLQEAKDLIDDSQNAEGPNARNDLLGRALQKVILSMELALL